MVRLWQVLCFASLGFAACAAEAVPSVVVLPVNGAIGPASSDFITRGLARADKDGAPLVVLELDTPGGLDTSMRDIIKAILASRIPVVTYVAPSGARAASAGTYILYASHVAAMAPGTNLGAATPIAIGMPGPSSPAPAPKSDKKSDKEAGKDKAEAESETGETVLTRKQVHDASAYIRGLAQMRGRNADWGERAVREAVSLSADEALAQHVVDVVARDIPELLVKLDGRVVNTVAGEQVLHTAGVGTVTEEPDWKTRFLAVITDPSVALILMMLGVYGLFFEFSNPGLALPGVVGAICILVGLFALHMLPVNYAGLGLVLLGMCFLVAEAFLPSYGSLGVGGIIAFAVGSVMLIDTDVPGFGVPFSLIAALAVLTGIFVFAVSSLALKARRRPVVTGGEAMIGSVGIALEDTEREGWARVRSEHWRVRSTTPLKRGQSVRVTARDGLILTVMPVDAVVQGATS